MSPNLNPSPNQVSNRATLEFVLLTRKSSPERGRTHGFRVSTCAAPPYHHAT